MTFGYYALDRLTSVTTAAGARRFVHDGHTIIAEYDGAGANLHRYIHGPGVDEPVAWDDRSDPADIERFYAHADERGSVIGYSDYADRMVRLNRYDEYGNPQGGVVNGGFGFTGHPWLPEIDMYYYRARIYNPQLARFMQPDPIGYDAGMNLYAYVSGDPVNLIDPSGLASTSICTGTRICVWPDPKTPRDPYTFHGASYVVEAAGFASFIRGGSRAGGPAGGSPPPSSPPSNSFSPPDQSIIVTASPLVFGFDLSQGSRPPVIFASHGGVGHNRPPRGFGAFLRRFGGWVGAILSLCGDSPQGCDDQPTGPQITFGHGARHLEGTGLSQWDVEREIVRDIASRLSSSGLPDAGSFGGRVPVSGVPIAYRAFVLPGGRIHVGTYFPPR